MLERRQENDSNVVRKDLTETEVLLWLPQRYEHFRQFHAIALLKVAIENADHWRMDILAQ